MPPDMLTTADNYLAIGTLKGCTVEPSAVVLELCPDYARGPDAGSAVLAVFPVCALE